MDQTTPKLGQILEKNVNQRDAIHIAVAPVIANDWLEPGQHVGLVDFDVAGIEEPFIGIVDPFLCDRVEKGQKFWLFLYPGTITSLRHAWTHPAFQAMSEAKRREILNG